MKVVYQVSDVAGDVVRELQDACVQGIKPLMLEGKFQLTKEQSINRHIERAISSIVKDDIRGQQPVIVD